MATHQLSTTEAQESALAYAASKAGITATAYLQRLLDREALQCSHRQRDDEAAAFMRTYQELSPADKEKIKAEAERLKPTK